MSDKEKEMQEENDEGEIIIEMADDEGNTSYYCQEMLLTVGDDKYALLVPAHDEHEVDDSEDCCCGCDEDTAFFAKIVLDENGEEVFVEPTDEEFEAVCKAYDELLEDDEE